MSKRKLSVQQRRRIAEQRAAKKQNKTTGPLTEDALLGDLEPGVVIAHYGKEAVIEGSARSQKCHIRANLSLCTGDHVMWRAGPKTGVVESQDPRNSEIQRPDAYGKMRTIAANISQLIITVAPEPEPHLNLIDRYIIAAKLQNLMPLIVINKGDLINNDNLALINLIDQQYSALNIDVIKVCAKTQDGLDELQHRLDGNTSIFVGQSGVGKSSLIKKLMPDEDIRIGELSDAAAKGRHTTTHAQLYRFECGGYCIDSPGIREFGLWHASPEQVLAGFPDIAEITESCRFRDCKHASEPGCAIKDAVEQNTQIEARYASYKSILDQLDDVNIQTHSGIKNR